MTGEKRKRYSDEGACGGAVSRGPRREFGGANGGGHSAT